MYKDKTAQRGEQELWTKACTRQHTKTKPNKGKREEELSRRKGLLSSCLHLKQKKKKPHTRGVNVTLLTFEII
jgi:hypothetical protein